MKYERIATNVIYDFIYNELGYTANDIYIVWACHILGDEKYLISTEINDGRYYEVTIDVGNGFAYVDVYKKELQNMVDITYWID